MPLPGLKTIKWVTTDCYGTLIDWEKGIVDACKKEAAKDVQATFYSTPITLKIVGPAGPA